MSHLRIGITHTGLVLLFIVGVAAVGGVALIYHFFGASASNVVYP